jgi:hypothetical protein
MKVTYRNTALDKSNGRCARCSVGSYPEYRAQTRNLSARGGELNKANAGHPMKPIIGAV